MMLLSRSIQNLRMYYSTGSYGPEYRSILDSHYKKLEGFFSVYQRLKKEFATTMVFKSHALRRTRLGLQRRVCCIFHEKRHCEDCSVGWFNCVLWKRIQVLVDGFQINFREWPEAKKFKKEKP
jgi:hypothetical protein